ncbi:unnamed protein product [Scytosiphon promiscuus]
MHLKGAVSKYGGRTTPFMSMKGVTHVIAENLSGVKTDKAMKSLKMKVVHPDWLNRCIEEGKLLPDAPFRVVRSQKLGMGNFFASSSSASPYCRDSSKGSSNDGQKENKREEKSKRRRSFPGKTPAVITGDVVDGRKAEKRRRDQRGLSVGEAKGECGATVAVITGDVVDGRKGEKRRRDQRGLSGGEAKGECSATVKARSSIEYRDRSRKDTRDVGIRAKGNGSAPERKRTHQSSNGGSSTSNSREGVRGARKDRSAVSVVADREKRCSEGISSIHGRSGTAEHGSAPHKHCMREATSHDMPGTTARKRSRHAAAAVATDAEIRKGRSGFQELDYREDDDGAGDASAASPRGAQHV